jgi:hypothetical protein
MEILQALQRGQKTYASQVRSTVNSNHMETSKQTLHVCLHFVTVCKTGGVYYGASRFNSVEAVTFSHQNW